MLQPCVGDIIMLRPCVDDIIMLKCLQGRHYGH
jgi:hypothetical protein